MVGTKGKKQSIAMAMRSTKVRMALNQLVGCPRGGWPETQQALRQIQDTLCPGSARNFTVLALIDSQMVVDVSMRYRWRE
jgi:hypothetical protein